MIGIALRLGPNRVGVEFAAVMVGVAPADGQYTDRIVVSLEAARHRFLAIFKVLDQRGALR